MASSVRRWMSVGWLRRKPPGGVDRIGGMQDSPMLIIESGQLAGQRWLVDSDVVIIGREVGLADLLLPERQVSRRHARIERTPGGFVISDLESKNGTFLNGKEVKEPANKRSFRSSRKTQHD